MANCDLYVAQIGDHNSLTNGILIDEVAIFDYERTLSEIQNYAGNQLSGFENGLLAYWNFNEGNGATSYDLGPNSYNGTFNANYANDNQQNSSNSYLINWSPNGESTPSITVQPTTITTYTVDVTSGSTTCQDSVTISVNPTYDITIDSSFCDSIFWIGNWLGKFRYLR